MGAESHLLPGTCYIMLRHTNSNEQLWDYLKFTGFNQHDFRGTFMGCVLNVLMVEIWRWDSVLEILVGFHPQLTGTFKTGIEGLITGDGKQYTLYICEDIHIMTRIHRVKVLQY